MFEEKQVKRLLGQTLRSMCATYSYVLHPIARDKLENHKRITDWLVNRAAEYFRGEIPPRTEGPRLEFAALAIRPYETLQAELWLDPEIEVQLRDEGEPAYIESIKLESRVTDDALNYLVGSGSDLYMNITDIAFKHIGLVGYVSPKNQVEKLVSWLNRNHSNILQKIIPNEFELSIDNDLNLSDSIGLLVHKTDKHIKLAIQSLHAKSEWFVSGLGSDLTIQVPDSSLFSGSDEAVKDILIKTTEDREDEPPLVLLNTILSAVLYDAMKAVPSADRKETLKSLLQRYPVMLHATPNVGTEIMLNSFGKGEEAKYSLVKPTIAGIIAGLSSMLNNPTFTRAIIDADDAKLDRFYKMFNEYIGGGLEEAGDIMGDNPAVLAKMSVTTLTVARLYAILLPHVICAVIDLIEDFVQSDDNKLVPTPIEITTTASIQGLIGPILGFGGEGSVTLGLGMDDGESKTIEIADDADIIDAVSVLERNADLTHGAIRDASYHTWAEVIKVPKEYSPTLMLDVASRFMDQWYAFEELFGTYPSSGEG